MKEPPRVSERVSERVYPPPAAPNRALPDGFAVVGQLSRGRTIDVYDVWSEERGCRCVAKLLRPDRASDSGARRRLLAEGRLLEQLTHPHIVRCYETIEEPSPVVILEAVGGRTLSDLIHRGERELSVRELAFLGLHLCSALRYLHGKGRLHLDLKPSNVISEGGRAKLIDLGLARAPGRVGSGIGTRRYMAPEQARGEEVGAAADVWGIGVVLFEAASARRPFARGSARGGYEQLERRLEPVSEHRRLPAALADAIDSCLEPAPGARPSLEELGRELRGTL
jgi:serine/threonine protein kinase